MKYRRVFNIVLLIISSSIYSCSDPDKEEKTVGDACYAEVQEIASTIQALKEQPCLVYSILTDSHEYPTEESTQIVDSTYQFIKCVNELCPSDGVVHIGDALCPNNDTIYSDWTKVNYYLGSNIDRLARANDAVFYVLGNHDGLNGAIVNEFKTNATLYSKSDAFIERENESPWYYIDYPDIETRVVFLAIPSRDKVESGNVIYGIGHNQMNWIAHNALKVGNGWSVIFFGHINPVHPDFSSSSRIVFSELTNAFSNHSTFQNEEWDIREDFSSTHSRIIAFISGHAHADAIIRDNSVFSSYQFSFPIVVIAASNPIVGGNLNPGYSNPERKLGTLTQYLWDTMVYRPDLNKLFFIRFGAGEDRVLTVPPIMGY